MQPEPVTLTEGQEGTDMGFFHEVPGGCGDHTRAEHVVFQRQWPRFAAVLVSDGCVECWTLCAPLSGHCFRSHHSCGSHMSQ